MVVHHQSATTTNSTLTIHYQFLRVAGVVTSKAHTIFFHKTNYWGQTRQWEESNDIIITFTNILWLFAVTSYLSLWVPKNPQLYCKFLFIHPHSLFLARQNVFYCAASSICDCVQVPREKETKFSIELTQFTGLAVKLRKWTPMPCCFLVVCPSSRFTSFLPSRKFLAFNAFLQYQI